jgi:hypothetical protein
MGFVVNNSSLLTGLGTVIKNWKIPFFGFVSNAKLDGLGKYYFPDGVQYVGRFRNGIF